MNFEKWMKKRGNNKLNAYAKNPYHVSWIKRMPMWSKIAVPAALAMTAAVVVVSVGVLPNLMTNKGAMSKASNQEAYSSYVDYKPGNQTSKSQQTPASQYTSEFNPPMDGDGWETMAAYYPSFTHDSLEYTITNQYGAPSVSSTYIDTKIDDINATDSRGHVATFEIYKIRNIDEEFAVALRRNQSAEYIIYINAAAHFHDIEDFETLLNPRLEMDITGVKYVNYTGRDFTEALTTDYTNYEKNAIYDILLADKSIDGYTSEDYDYESSTEYYLLTFKIDALNAKGITARFFNSGYIVFSLYGQNHLFELGQTTYQQFASYITTNPVR